MKPNPNQNPLFTLTEKPKRRPQEPRIPLGYRHLGQWLEIKEGDLVAVRFPGHWKKGRASSVKQNIKLERKSAPWIVTVEFDAGGQVEVTNLIALIKQKPPKGELDATE